MLVGHVANDADRARYLGAFDQRRERERTNALLAAGHRVVKLNTRPRSCQRIGHGFVRLRLIARVDH